MSLVEFPMSNPLPLSKTLELSPMSGPLPLSKTFSPSYPVISAIFYPTDPFTNVVKARIKSLSC